MSGRKLKLILGIATLATLFSLLFSVAFAQEVSGPESSYSVNVYDDTNGNGKHDEEEVAIPGIQVQLTTVFHKACWQVTADDTFTEPITQTSSFGVGVNAACTFFLISSRGGMVSYNHYDAYRSSADGGNLAPPLWIMRKCNCKVNLPIVARAWSGQR